MRGVRTAGRRSIRPGCCWSTSAANCSKIPILSKSIISTLPLTFPAMIATPTEPLRPNMPRISSADGRRLWYCFHLGTAGALLPSVRIEIVDKPPRA